MYGYCNVLASAAAKTMTPVRLIAHEMAAIVGRSRDGSLWRQNGPGRSDRSICLRGRRGGGGGGGNVFSSCEKC